MTISHHLRSTIIHLHSTSSILQNNVISVGQLLIDKYHSKFFKFNKQKKY